MRTDGFEREVAKLDEQLRHLTASRRTHVFHSEWWNEQLLEWSMSHPSFKTQLFRFVDVFPAAGDDAEVLRHLEEYFELAELPKILDLGLELADQLPGGGAISAAVARRMISRMARQFIVGSRAGEVIGPLEAMWTSGTASTVDVLGEKTVTTDDAERYARRVDELLSALLVASPNWPARRALESDDLGTLPRVNVSVKPTALSAHFAPLSADDGLADATNRLRPVLRKATAGHGLIHIDMEHHEVKDLTLELVAGLLGDHEFDDLDLGITIQAYLRDSYDDLERLIAVSANRATPLTVRLVKGAYWDSETTRAGAEGWPIPVFTNKAETDANFERCARLLHDHHGEVRAAFGSHNLSSLAYAITYARQLGIPDNGHEVQMLFGMAEPFHEAIRQLGLRLRVYAPVGELLPGMAYLVRRLLENTANESFVRAHLREDGHQPVGHRPGARASVRSDPVANATGTNSTRPPYAPEPLAQWHRSVTREDFAASIDVVRRDRIGATVPGIIDGVAQWTPSMIESVDPGLPSRRVASSSDCGVDEADRAIGAAGRAWENWRRTSSADRAAVLFRTAQWMRERRNELAALEVFEAGKPWSDADADVCEAIDYCEYYGREMLRYAAGAAVQSPPGEVNAMRYVPRGIGVVIAPWNFPLAIPTGMVTAALVTGNAVIFKPAEQTPLIASKLVEALRASGLPDGVLSFVPGRGEAIGPHLVAHPDVAFIAFTGSKAVGLGIIEAAAVQRVGQRQVKNVIVEMGGKNALIVDSDADIDQAVPITIASAFGYSGQKCSACSRVIVVGAIYEHFLERLVGAARDLRIGHPERPGTQIGPLIDEEAYDRVRGYIERAADSGEVLLARDDVPSDGWFVGPAIVGDVRPGTPIATDEIFGPVLAVMRAESIGEAILTANDTDYALTAGIISRSPAHVRLATDELRAGNVYVNRTITGAVVGRQPFGGYGLSGIGSKAGGPDYLSQFLEPRVVSENTVRQGSAPADGVADPRR